MATQVVNRVRAESPERWQKALPRALLGGVEVFRVAGTGEMVATSATRLGTVYRVDATHCECLAALNGDAVCAHRAAARFILGMLTDDSAPTRCPSCAGAGQVECWVAGHVAGPMTCSVCAGSGRRPVERPREVPAVEIVAEAA
jgi:hypothetical protein